MILKKLYIAFLLLAVGILWQTAFGQTLPVQTSIQVLPPYTTDYQSFVSPINGKLRATATLTDLQEPLVEARFRISIEGAGIRIQTPANFRPSAPVTLLPGVSTVMEGSMWTEYFEPQNMEFSGIDRQTFINDGRFPEGMYTFSVIAVDYASGKELSRVSHTIAWLKLNDEPTIISPKMASVQPINGPQNILFQWQLNTPVNTGIPFTPVYKLFLYELTVEDIDPIYAMENGQTMLVFESDELYTTSLNYTVANPTLDAGKTYMFRVQAIDPTGQNEFRNDGYSPNSYFYYGYPMGGVIEARAPSNKYSFNKADPQRFTFSSPSKLTDNQQFVYHLKIVSLEDENDDPTDALTFNNAWDTQKSSPTSNRDDYALEVRKPFDKDQWYAWQVTAKSGEQEIAASEPQVFHGPPLIESFKAGIHKVIVTNLTNNDLNDLTGQGLIKISETDTDSTMTEIPFEGLQVKVVGGRFVLESGEIEYDIADPIETELVAREKGNAAAYFYPEKIKLDKKQFQVYGHVEYPFPHPVNGSGGELPAIVTTSKWVNFDDYAPFGEFNLTADNEFDLVDPYGFRMVFSESSQIQVFYDEYELQLDGTVLVNEAVVSIKENRVELPFRRAKQLYYMQESGSKAVEDIAIAPNVNAHFNSTDYVLDMSEDKSPKHVDDDDWKGIYFNRYDLTLEKNADLSEQLSMRKVLEYELNQNSGKDVIARIDGYGLDFYWEKDLRGDDIATFNGFPAKLNDLQFNIENSSVQECSWTGTIQIPVISDTEEMGFVMPITKTGFSDGYLAESLENRTFVFSPYGGENRADITIRRAVFEDNNHLNLVADIEIPELNAKIERVKDLHLFGDYTIGFGKPGGTITLSTRVDGKYKSHNVQITKLGASLFRGNYVFSYETEIIMGEGFSGSDGEPPVLSFYGVAEASDEVAAASGGSGVVPETPIPTFSAERNPKEMQVDELEINFTSKVVEFNGKIYVARNDPDWGTVFRGEIHGTQKLPSNISIGGSIMYGKKDFDYFYLDAYFMDETGMGLPVVPEILNMVGCEGWIFSNMNVKDGSLVLDGSNDIGFNLFVQLLDFSTKGAAFQMDGLMEFRSGDGDLKIGTDISVLNSNVRSSSSSGAIKQQIASEVAKEVAKQTLEALGGFDETVNIAGVDLRLKLDETEGLLGFSSGGTAVSVSGDIAGTPAVGVDFSSGPVGIALNASMNKTGKFKFEAGGLKTEMDYATSGSKFHMGAGDFHMSAGVDNSTKTSTMELNVGSSLKAYTEANVEKKYGEFLFESGDVKLEMSGDMINTSGEFLADFGNSSVYARGDKGKKQGALDIDIEGFETGFGFDQINQSGFAHFGTSDFGGDVAINKSEKTMGFSGFVGDNSFEIKGESDGGELNMDIAGVEAKTWVYKTGASGLEFEEDDFHIRGEINKKDKTGSLLFQKGEFKIAGATTEDGGNVDLDIDGNSFKGEVGANLYRLDMNVQGVRMAALDSQDSTALFVGADGQTFAIGGDPSNHRGFVNWTNGGDKIFVKADRPANSGKVDFNLDGIGIGAEMMKGYQSASFSMDGLAFGGAVSSDSARIYFNEGSSAYTLQVSPVGNNVLKIQNDMIDLLVAANKSENSGRFHVGLSDYDLAAGMSEDQLDLSFEDKVNQYTLAAMANKTDQKASFELGIGNLKVAAFGDLTNKSGKFDFSYGDIAVLAEGSMSDMYGTMKISEGDFQFEALSDGVKGHSEINLALSADNKLGASFDQETGAAALDLNFSGNMAKLDLETSGKILLNTELGDNLVHIDADKGEGGKVEVAIGSDKIASWVYASGLAGFQLKQGALEMLLESNSAEKAGALSYDNGHLIFGAVANGQQGTGSLDFGMDGYLAHGAYSDQVQEINLSKDAMELAAIASRDTTGLRLIDSNQLLEIGGDPSSQNGFVKLQNGTDGVFVAVDRPQDYGKLDYTYGHTVLKGLMSSEETSGYFKVDGLEMSSLATADSLGASFVTPELDLKFGINPSAGNQYIAALSGDYGVSVLTENGGADAAFSLNVMNQLLSAAVASSGVSLRYSGAVSFETLISEDGLNKLDFSGADLAAMIQLGSATVPHAVSFSSGENSLAAQINDAGDAGMASIQLGSNRAKTVFDANTQMAVVGSGPDSLSIEHLGNGAGVFNMSAGNAAIRFNANPSEGTGQLSFTDGSTSFNLGAALVDETGTFVFDNSGSLISGNYQDGEANFQAKSNHDFIRTNLSTSGLEAALGSSSDSVRIVFTDQSAAIDFTWSALSLQSSLNLNSLDNELAFTLPGSDLTVSTALAGEDFSFAVDAGSSTALGLAYNRNEGLASLNLKQSDLTIDYAGNKESLKGSYQNLGFQIFSNLALELNLPNFNMYIPSLSLLSGYTLDDLRGLTINGRALTAELGNVDFSQFSKTLKIGSINFPKAGVPVLLVLAKDYLIVKINESQTFKYSKSAGWEVSIQEAYGLKLAVDNDYNWQQVAFDIPQLMALEITPESLKAQASGKNFLTVTDDAFALIVDQASLKIDNSSLELVLDQNKKLAVANGLVNLQMGEAKASLIGKEEVQFAYGNTFQVEVTAEKLAFDLNEVSVDLDQFDNLVVESGDKKLQFSKESLYAKYTDYVLTLDETAINVAAADDFLKLNFDGNMAASVSGVTLDIMPSESLDLKAADFSTGITAEGLTANVKDVKVSWDQSQKLTLSGFGGHELSVTPASFDYKNNDMSLLFVTGENVKFGGYGFDVDVSGRAGLSAKYETYALTIAADGASKLEFGSDNYLDLTAETFAAKYEDFAVSTGGSSLLSFESPYGAFDLKETDFSLAKDGYKLAIDAEKNLTLTGPDLSFDLDPTNYGIKYQDYTIALSPENVISLASETLNLSTEKLDVSLGDFNVKMNLETEGAYSAAIAKGEEAAFEINQNGTSSARFSDFSLSFDEESQVTVSYDALQFMGGMEGLSVDYNDYKVALGKEKLLSFEMPDMSLSFDQSAMDFSYKEYELGFSEEQLYGSVEDLYVGIGFTNYMFDLKGLGDHNLSLSYDGVDYHWGNNLQLSFAADKNIKFSGYDLDFELDPTQGFDFNYNNFGIELGADKALTFVLDGANNSIDISPDLFRLQYEGVDLGFGANRDLWFRNDPYAFELSVDALALAYEDMNLVLANTGGFNFNKGQDIKIVVAEDVMDFQIPDYGIAMDMGILSLKTLAYDLNTEELMVNIGGYDVGLSTVDGAAAIRLTNRNTVDLSYNADLQSKIKLYGVKLNASPNSFWFGYEDDFQLSANPASFDFQLSNFKMKVGMDTLVSFNKGSLNFMVLLNDATGMIENFQPGLYAGIGDYYTIVNPNGLSFYQGLVDRKRTFTIDKSYQFIYDEYELERFTVEVSKGTGYSGRLSLDLPNLGYGGAVGFMDNGKVAVDLKTPIDDLKSISIRADQTGAVEGMIQGNIDQISANVNVDDLDGYMKYSKEGFKVSGEYIKDLIGIDLGGTEEGEYLEGTPEINVSESKYIGSITEVSGGFFRGAAKLMIGGRGVTIVGNVRSDQIVKVDGAFDFSASKEDWHMYLGTSQEPIKVASFAGSMSGWLHVSDSDLKVGFRNEYKIGGSVNLTAAGAGVKFTATAWNYLGGEFTAGYTMSNGMISSIQFKKLRIEAGMGFELKGKVCYVIDCSGFTVASVSLEGYLEGYFEDISLNGHLEGKAEILGIKTGKFSISPSISL